MKTFWLNLHAAYSCRHSGVCCSSRWPIPVEPDRAAAVAAEIAAGRVRPMIDPWLQPAIGAPEDVAGTLALQPDGHCVWHAAPPHPAPAHPHPAPRTAHGAPTGAARSCAIYAMRPRSCAHFPYVCLIDQRGVHVTLSHYCPTAAAMLVDHTGPIEVVPGLPVFPDGSLPEGLDAREVLPPLESPSRLVDLDAYSDWERRLVRSLGHGTSPLPRAADPPDRALFDLARDAVPAMLSWPDAPADLAHTWAERIAPDWPRLAPLSGRYLAARAFASWVAYQGEGLPAVERSVAIADAVFRVELARQPTLDRDGIIAAIRQADLLLVHYVDPSAFAAAC